MTSAAPVLFAEFSAAVLEDERQCLLLGIVDESEEQERRHAIYTAERLLAKRPEAARTIVHYLAQGYGMLRIAKLVGVHHMTVRAVRDKFPADIDMERKRLAGLALTAGELCMERIIEEIEHLPKNMLGLTAAQMIDKFQLLSGGVTSRPGKSADEKAPSADDFAEWIKALPSATATTEGADTGISAADPAQMAAADPGPIGDPAGLATDPGSMPTDVQSSVSSFGGVNATVDATERAAATTHPAPAPTGGGGGPRAGAPVSPRMGERKADLQANASADHSADQEPHGPPPGSNA